ncbi:hypothetical protein J5N97_009213 [Dioscorea zingiberensis]|uniref:NAD-dependent epimerase/dehydratase domain-containing protein n=1 Tax=Dioscorea zingiberensis TaxID=325984 RepID=A0A9D5HLK8_9LILI|nr:hypothetical protein J5N97_009213 [Dioscorea zingiberensis]
MSGKVVCVTGASGYIASWLVKLLLGRGYTVKATVRDLGDPKKTEHLRTLAGASERLQLFKANLLEEGSFDAVVNGCECVFHTASPFYYDTKDPQVELIDPAVKGTLNVLGSCAKISSIKKVVVTSSIAAVSYNERPRTPDVIVDETWFSSAELCERTKAWYVLSKTLAEECAWKFSKENDIELVTINPAMVIGPLLQPTLNTSCAAILDLITGSSTYPNATFGWVNVKDVALAHILAYEVPSANGRYCLVERVAHYSEIVKKIHELYPSLELPQKCADDKPFVPTHQVSKEKVRSLGLDYTPLETGLKETIESLKENGKGDPKKTEHLRTLARASERLQLFKANLLEEGSFDDVVNGCECVFHTASPFYHDIKDPQVELIDPAVKGTLNVLGSCAKFSSIKRVVVTSSMAAVLYNERSRTPDVIVDETWFSSAKFCERTKMDVALAHILAYEAPSANGRYCLVERVAHYSEIVKKLHELYPSLELPQKCADDKPFVPTYQVSKEKARSLGLDYTPLETSLKETIESSKEKGFVTF